MKMSANGLARLSREEGLRLVPYNDSAGHATVGVGHLIHHGRVTQADLVRYRNFTKAQAIALLKRDVASREKFVDRVVRVPLNQNEFDALVSLVFNIGTGAFAQSTVLRKLNAGDRRGAADAFLMWKVGGAGLYNRRKRERALFLTKPKDPLHGLGPKQRKAAERLLYHRRGMVNEAKTGKGPKYYKHLKHARNWLHEEGGVVYYRNRAHGSQRDTLNRVIRAKTGRMR